MKNILLLILSGLSLVLNGCLVKKQVVSLLPTPTRDTISFTLTEQNNIKVKVLLNRKDTLDLKFDSGATGLLLTHEAIKNKTQLLSGGNETVPTRDYVKLNRPGSLQLSRQFWDSLYIYPVRLSGHGTDGSFVIRQYFNGGTGLPQ